MGIATVSKYVDIHFPGIEVAQVIFTDGDTYASRKFRQILGGIATQNGVTGAASAAIVLDLGTNNYTRTAVIRQNLASNNTATIVLYGIMGN